MAITPDGLFAFVTNAASSTVSKISTTTNLVVDTIPVGTTPFQVAITPSGAFAYVSNFNSSTVSVIDTTLDTIVATIPVATPGGIAITANGDFAYVTSQLITDVTVIDTTTNTNIGTIPAGTDPSHIAITNTIGKPSATYTIESNNLQRADNKYKPGGQLVRHHFYVDCNGDQRYGCFCWSGKHDCSNVDGYIKCTRYSGVYDYTYCGCL